ncbi:hypothetical protein [Edaphobacter albus]|uniref:hypothetical protein n=1 Tax=Edaphobacter sp. 4G125 TaxID=2763071 RepID=UPI0016496103|nr:hypothetical protein [Edaphobacter sp. 4G125]QNI37489.1 hypothetical protein H7846_04085 [Edaphobacter sp. 4G125]
MNQPLLDPKHLYTHPVTKSDCVSIADDYGYASAEGDGATAASAGDLSVSEANGDSAKSASAGNGATSIARGYAARSSAAGDFAKAHTEDDFSMASVAGDHGSALSSGECSIAMAAGVGCKVQAGERGVFATCYYAPGNVLRILVGYVGENGIKADTPYRIIVDREGNATWREAD